MKKFYFLLSFMLLALGIGNAWGENVTVTLDKLGANLSATSNTTVKTTIVGDYTLNYLQGKKQGDAILLAKGTDGGTSFISNKTPIPGAINSITVYINSGASSKTTYHCAFSKTECTSRYVKGSTAQNIIEGKSNKYTCSVANANYFCIALGNNNNGQVLKLDIEYTPTSSGGEPEPVIVKTLKSIAVTGQQITYEQGDRFRFNGTCTATYSVTKDDVAQADETKEVTPTSVSTPDMNTTGDKVVTVSYTENEVTVETTYTITVTENTITAGEYCITPNNTFWGTSFSGSLSGDALNQTYIGKQDDITITYAKGSASSLYINDSQCRTYKGTVMTFSVPTGYVITAIAFTANDNNWAGTHSASVGTMTDNKNWSGSAPEVTITFGDKCQITNICVTYAEAGDTPEVPTLDAPTFSIAAGKYTEAKEVTLSAKAGTIHYTLDGTTPNAESTAYTAPIVLNECGEITIKAIAISGENTSSVASATYTIKLPLTNSQDNPYTEAEAIAVYDGGCYDNQEVYVMGVVQTAQFYSSNTYTITLEGGFQFYKFYEAVGEVTFTEDYIVAGDTLVACGKLVKFNTTYELGAGCYLVDCKPYSAPKVDISNTPETAYTVAQAIALIDDITSDLTKQVYVKGQISEVESFNDSYGSITYWIKDEEGNTFQCYRGLGLNNEQFASVDDLVVGSQVVVYGTLKIHNSTYEFDYNNYIVSLTLPSYTVTATAENGTVEGAGEYEHGTEVTLTATPADGYKFTCWTSGKDTVSTANPFTFTVTSDTTLVANFQEVVVEPTTETVYFVNNKGWENVNVYAWTTEINAEWPGVAATKETEQICGYDVYSYTAEAGAYAAVIFNNGSDQQTADLVWTAGKYYVQNGWYTREDAEALLAGTDIPSVITYVLRGVGGDWTKGIALTVNPNNENEYVLLGQDIAEGDAVKVVTLTDGQATAWCGNVDEYSVAHSFDGDGNIVLAPGKYNFYYKVNENLIYIAAVEPEVIEYVLNGGQLPLVGPTNAELWEAFKTYYKTFYNEARADQPITAVATFMTQGEKIFTDAASEYKWLGDYLVQIATQQGYTINSEPLWRWHADAFFNCNQHTSWPASADFTEAGKPENWVNVYPAATEVELPTIPVAEDYVLPTPTKTGCTFKGWYDNAEGTGDAYTVIPAGWSGTLYAIWKQGTATALENIAVEGKAVKAIVNGQLIIIKNGVQYNAQGQVIK